MSQQLSELQAQVSRLHADVRTAIDKLQSLADQIEANKTDPAALQALADGVRGDADQLEAKLGPPPAPQPGPQPQPTALQPQQAQTQPKHKP